jgi:ubiquinone/menaquinone biosynthesis C-methylase UbiE
MDTTSSSDEADPSSLGEGERWSRQETSSAWAANDDLFEGMTGALTEAVIERAELRPGLAVLDLACGTGKMALLVAEQITSAGTVCASDVSAGMLDVARHNAMLRGVTNIQFRLADAHRLPFPDHAFDRVLCRLGVMFFRAATDALGEVRRVLTTDGRAIFLAWGRHDTPFFQTTLDVMTERLGVPAALRGTPVPFRFAEGGVLADAFRSAGFSSVIEERRDVAIRWFGSAQEFVRWRLETSSGPFQALFRELVSGLEPKARERLSVEMIDRVGEYEQDSTVSLPAEVVLIVASP